VGLPNKIHWDFLGTGICHGVLILMVITIYLWVFIY